MKIIQCMLFLMCGLFAVPPSAFAQRQPFPGGGGVSPGSASITSYGAVSGKAVVDGSMVSTASTFSAAGNSTSPATPSGTTTFNNDVLVSMFSLSAAFTPPGTPTARVNSAYSAGVHMGLWIGDQTVSTAGAYAANTGTVSSTPWAAASIPLVPVTGQTISLITSNVNNSSGSSVAVVFTSTPGAMLIACVAGFSGYTDTFPSNWNLIVANVSGGTQNITCAAKQAGTAEPSSYTFSGSGTFVSAAIVEYANVAAIDNRLTSATANFSSSDVGKLLCAESLNVRSAGFLSCTPVNLVLNSTTIYPLFTNTQTSSVSTSAIMWGSDSTASFSAATAALGNAGGTIVVPPGIFFLTAGQFKLPYNVVVNILGAGAEATIGFGSGADINYPGGSFIVGIPDSANDPIVGYVTGPGTGIQMFRTNSLIQGITIRSNKTGTGDCLTVAMEFVTVQKNNFIGCGGDAIRFLLNNTVYSGLDIVTQNFIEYSGNYGVETASGAIGSNYLIDGNEMDFNVVGCVKVSGQQQVTISNNQLQFGGAAVAVTNTTSNAIAIGPGNWIDGGIVYSTAGGQGPDIFDNYFEQSQSISFNGQTGARITGNFFFAGVPFKVGSTQTNVTFDASNVNAGMTTSFTGTSGTTSCAFNVTGGQSKASCFLSAYANTGAAQTWTYPLPMATIPFVTESAGSCGTFNPSSTATVLTLPANAGMTAETCQIIIEGQTN